jgi:hypothetical protein
MFTASKVTRLKTLSAALLGIAIVFSALSSGATPALALGHCGPNGHRGPFGHCRWGGQNEAWCLRHTGHGAGFGHNGTRWCGR